MELGWIRSSSSRFSGWPSSRMWLPTHRRIFHASRSANIAYLYPWFEIKYLRIGGVNEMILFKRYLVWFRRPVPRYVLPATTGFITSICWNLFWWPSICSKGRRQWGSFKFQYMCGTIIVWGWRPRGLCNPWCGKLNVSCEALDIYITRW